MLHKGQVHTVALAELRVALNQVSIDLSLRKSVEPKVAEDCAKMSDGDESGQVLVVEIESLGDVRDQFARQVLGNTLGLISPGTVELERTVLFPHSNYYSF